MMRMNTPRDTVKLPPASIHAQEFPEGQFPCLAYPFALHNVKQLPWGFCYKSGKFYIVSNTCAKATSDSSRICRSCKRLKSNDNWLEGIRRRFIHGVDPNTSHAYKPIEC
jgi:hypothetical protein